MVNLLRRNCRVILAVCFAVMLTISINTNVADADENTRPETLRELLKEVVKNRGITTTAEGDEVGCFMEVVADLGDAIDACESQGCKLQVLLTGLIDIFRCINSDDDGGGSDGGGDDGNDDDNGGGGGSGSGGGDGGGSGSGSL
ncbi:MAG: hypothetical protein ACUZ8H_14285 [Candidatus Anammoxibacter sp.]